MYPLTIAYMYKSIIYYCTMLCNRSLEVICLHNWNFIPIEKQLSLWFNAAATGFCLGEWKPLHSCFFSLFLNHSVLLDIQFIDSV